MEINKTVEYKAKYIEKDKMWEIIIRTVLGMQQSDDVEPETVEFTAKTFDVDLERGIQVILKATENHFKDIPMSYIKE